MIALLLLVTLGGEGKWTPQQVVELGPAWVKSQGFQLPLNKLWDDKKGTESQEYVKKEERQLLDVVARRAKKREEDEAKRKREHPLMPFKITKDQSIADGRLTPKYREAMGKSLRQTFSDHFAVTTAGVFSTPELLCTASVCGYDNLLFSVDYPFESNQLATQWFATLQIADADKAKLAHRNAERLLKIKPLETSK